MGLVATHACPGRFFAPETLKLIIIHLMMHYDFKHTDEGRKGLVYLPNNLVVIPNPALLVLFKAERGCVIMTLDARRQEGGERCSTVYVIF